MIINTNLASINTLRQMGINEKSTQNSLAKLASGLRINSASDDAAGLTISEKMRGQISGLKQASTNAQTGISLVSTAEGALNETTSILQRMRELAVQASSDTNTTADRTAMQTETDQLISAINDIGNQTQFNTKNLLDGSLAGASGVSVGQNSTTGAVASLLQAAKVTASTTMVGASTIATGDFIAETINIDGTDIQVNWQNLSNADKATVIAGFGAGSTLASQNAATDLIVSTINSAIDQSGTNVAHISGFVDAAGKLNIESGSSGIDSKIKTSSTTAVLGEALGANGTTGDTGDDIYSGTTVNDSSAYNIHINGIQMQVTSSVTYTSGTTTMAAVAADLQTTINAAITHYNNGAGLSAGEEGYIELATVNATDDGRLQVLSQSGAISFSDSPGNSFTTSLGLDATSTSSSNGSGLTFQVGANAGQTMTVSIGDMRSNSLGITGINLGSTTTAQAAIDTIDKATAKVSEQRSRLGAAQNRLEHTLNNLGTSSQNITSAEANIRDVDMANEMTDFTKNNILQQASQAMLSQANQQAQGVLQLLR